MGHSDIYFTEFRIITSKFCQKALHFIISILLCQKNSTRQKQQAREGTRHTHSKGNIIRKFCVLLPPFFATSFLQ